MIDTDDIFIMNGTTITLHWDPEKLLPIQGSRTCNIELVLRILTSSSGSDFLHVQRNLQGSIILVKIVPNNGSIQFTFPPFDFPLNEVIIELKGALNRLIAGTFRIFGYIRSGVRWIFKFTKETITKQLIEFIKNVKCKKCKRWACNDWVKKQNITKTNEIAQNLPPCPCNKTLVTNNTIFKKEDHERIQECFHPNATCFRQKKITK